MCHYAWWYYFLLCYKETSYFTWMCARHGFYNGANWFMHSCSRYVLMGKPLKLKLPMGLSPVITVFIRKVVKLAQTALPQSLPGQEDLHTGTVINTELLYCIWNFFGILSSLHGWKEVVALRSADNAGYVAQLPWFWPVISRLPLVVWYRAKLDDNARLLDFTQKLEAACIGAVESGKMTKDLALLVHGSSKYVTQLLYALRNCSLNAATSIYTVSLTDYYPALTVSRGVITWTLKSSSMLLLTSSDQGWQPTKANQIKWFCCYWCEPMHFDYTFLEPHHSTLQIFFFLMNFESLGRWRLQIKFQSYSWESSRFSYEQEQLIHMSK